MVARDTGVGYTVQKVLRKIFPCLGRFFTLNPKPHTPKPPKPKPQALNPKP